MPARESADLTFELVWPEGALVADVDWRGNEVPILFDCRPAQQVRWRVQRRARRADRGRLRDPRRAGPGVSVAGQAARARLRLPPAGLSRRWRAARAAGRRVQVEFWRGPESRTRTQALTVTDAGTGAAAGSDLSDRALDRPGQARLVVGRPPHPRGGLRPLHEADRRRAARGHVPPHAGRRSEGRSESDVGAGVRLSEAILHRAGRSSIAALASAALRRGGLRLRLVPLRAIWCCFGSRSRSHPAATPISTGRPWASTRCAGPSVRVRSAAPRTRAGVSAWTRPSCRTTSCRRSTASARTNTSWT